MCIVGCLVASQACTHEMPTAHSPHPVLTTENVSRQCQMSPEGKFVPSWEPLIEGLVSGQDGGFVSMIKFLRFSFGVTCMRKPVRRWCGQINIYHYL